MPCFSIRIAQIICTPAVRLARRDGADGIVDFISENCIGCGYCVKGCPFNIPPISQVDRKSYQVDHKSYKCTLCSRRVGVGLGPARVNDHVRFEYAPRC
jgi:Fe-S-cluster-containing dehydrogenase component